MNYREKQLRNQIKKMEQRETILTTTNPHAPDYLLLEQENKDKEWEINALQKEIKSQAGVLQGLTELLGKEIKNPEDLKTVLQGKTLKEWLEYHQNYQKELAQDYQKIKDKLIHERSEVKNKLVQSKKEVKDLEKELGEQKKNLLKELAKQDEIIQEYEKSQSNFLKQHKATNYEEVSQKITELGKDNQVKQTKLSQQEKQKKDGEKVFNELVETIKPKTVIFMGKKKTKEKLTRLKTIFGYYKTDTGGISEEEG